MCLSFNAGNGHGSSEGIATRVVGMRRPGARWSQSLPLESGMTGLWQGRRKDAAERYSSPVAALALNQARANFQFS
jgi:hypothetical protein